MMGVLVKFLCYMRLNGEDDYEVAVEEGATFVRVGTGIFGERSYRITE